MATREEIWSSISPVVEELGYELFDIDVPSKRGGTLRVYISGLNSSAKVAVEGCAAVSRRVLELSNVEELLPGSTLLEVSSPGINRKLRLPAHFSGAIGERVRVFVPTSIKKQGFVVGKLISFAESVLTLEEEDSGLEIKVPYGDISKAHVDFKFN